MNHLQSPGTMTYRVAGFALLLFVLVGSATAQGRQRLSPEEQQERYEKQFEELITALDITEEQKPQFAEIMEASFADRLDILEDMQAGGDRSALRDQMMKLNEETDLALAEVLTSEQVEKYKEIQAERLSRRRRPQS